MMQSYIIQFERLPAAGTDCCPPRQPAFCVAEPLALLSIRDAHRSHVHNTLYVPLYGEQDLEAE